MLVGLDHVNLSIPPGEEEAARSFYGTLLGMTETPKPEPLASRGGCWFATGSVIVHLSTEAGFTPARQAHPAFLVSDLEALRSKLLAANVPVQPDSVLPSVRRFYAYDPFGNRIEFIQSGDGFSERDSSTAW